jgi:predicted phosphodiesterase
MRVAALYDIHGNIPALEATLREVHDARVDLVVVGGDALPGPMPRETLARLMAPEMPVRFIHGNGERIVTTHLAAGDISEVPRAHHEVIEWTARQLTAEQRQAIARWPSTYDLDIPEIGHTLFCHATPRSDSELFTRVTAEERLAVLFGGVNASVVVCGHTHMQFDRTVGQCRVINAGSVGMPFQSPSGAYWLLLGPDAQLRRTNYDFGAAATAMRATAYPQLEQLAVRYVLSPPAEEETLQMYAGAELT